jgi:electron transfer flavoprotein alpha subunit
MVKALVWVEHDNAVLKDATLSAVTAAAKLGEVHLLVAGSGCGAVAEAAAKIAGVAKVLWPTTPPMRMVWPRMWRR